MASSSPILSVPKVKTPASWQAKFISWLRLGRASTTVTAYLSDLQYLNRWHRERKGKDFDPTLLNNELILEYHDWCLGERGIKPATWNRRRSSLFALGLWSRESGVSADDSFRKIPKAKEMPQEPHWLSKTELDLLLKSVEKDRLGAFTLADQERTARNSALIALMVFAGLRVSEAIALQKKEIQITKQSARVIVRRGKGDKYRVVPLSTDALRMIDPWLSACEVEQVFKITAAGVQCMVARAGEKAGIQNLHPHRLRHTCAKTMLDAGTSIAVIMRILGHESMNTTSRYLTPSYEDMAAAVELIHVGKRGRK